MGGVIQYFPIFFFGGSKMTISLTIWIETSTHILPGYQLILESKVHLFSMPIIL